MKNKIMQFMSMFIFTISGIVVMVTAYLCRVLGFSSGKAIVLLISVSLSALSIIALNYYEYMIRRQNRISRNR